jgi:hypothetical protein
MVMRTLGAGSKYPVALRDAKGEFLSVNAQGAEPHGWLGTETLKTRFGKFEFKDGYAAL